MLPASNRGTGENVGFPDTCNTPTSYGTTSIPYVNSGSHGGSTGFSNTVYISGMNALSQAASIASTSGDEAGTAGPTKGTGAVSTGSPIVHIDGSPAVTLACPTTGNNKNNSIGAVVVPAITNVLFTDASEPRRVLEADRGPTVEVRDDLLCVRITRFTFALASQVGAALAANPGIAGVILDLSGCPGGELDAAVRLADLFVPRGTELGEMVDGDGDRRRLWARSESFSALPLALIVDGGTASAAEIFASAMSANGRAKIVGTRTYGKGVATVVRQDSSGVMRPEATYVDPQGRLLQGAGVVPDVSVRS